MERLLRENVNNAEQAGAELGQPQYKLDLVEFPVEFSTLFKL